MFHLEKTYLTEFITIKEAHIMNYSIVYSSKTGNTQLLAKTIQNTLSNENCIYFGEPSDHALDADLIFIGFWTDKGSCNEEIKFFLKTLQNKSVFLFGTAGFGGDPSYFDKILHSVKKNISSDNHIKGTYMCQGKMPASVKERYVKMSNLPVPVPNIKKMIDNFDQALSHPDEKDLLQLKQQICNL